MNARQRLAIAATVLAAAGGAALAADADSAARLVLPGMPPVYSLALPVQPYTPGERVWTSQLSASYLPASTVFSGYTRVGLQLQDSFANDTPRSAGAFASTQASASLTLIRRPNGLGIEDTGRERGSAGYDLLRVAASLTRALPRDWQVRAAVNGQRGNDTLWPEARANVLLPGALRGIADAGFGDHGLAANLELYSPNLCAARLGWNCRALAFYDRAYLRRNRVQGGELRSVAIGSVGVGMRMQMSRHSNVQIDYGHVLHADPDQVVSPNRLQFRLEFSY
ncbi:hypothetical protein HSX11_04730 [Oxalobacteraceae bacterium]|nr:hypothetical protein [Oxalobacteraceae bacterium]